MIPFKDPCKICLVRPACTKICPDRKRYVDTVFKRESILITLIMVIGISITVGSLFALSTIFHIPVFKNPLYIIFHSVTCTLAMVYVINRVVNQSVNTHVKHMVTGR